MRVFAMADLHLGFSTDKRMDVFGMTWKGHVEKIKENWIRVIENDDYVLLPGDISWAKRFDEAKSDLEFIDGLPGKKILVAGNHDFWWGSTDRLNEAYPGMRFLKRDGIVIGDVAVAATRGWVSPGDTWFKPEDTRTYKREIKRMEMAIGAAARKSEGMKLREFILMTHFPPTNDKNEAADFVEIINRSPVTKVVYGHLHGKEAHLSSIRGCVRNSVTGKVVEYCLTSADFLGFAPVRVL